MKTEQELKQLDLEKPYKAITSGYAPERFRTEEEARRYFRLHSGSACHLASYINGVFTVLAYKWR